jgi:hypothetical protein
VYFIKDLQVYVIGPHQEGFIAVNSDKDMILETVDFKYPLVDPHIVTNQPLNYR